MRKFKKHSKLVVVFVLIISLITVQGLEIVANAAPNTDLSNPSVEVRNLEELIAAFEDAADGDVIGLAGSDIIIQESVSLGSDDKHIYLVRMNDTVYIRDTMGGLSMKNVTIDGRGYLSENPMIRADAYLRLENVTFQNCCTRYCGGAIYSTSTLEIESCIFDNNTAMGEGGQIYSGQGSIAINNSIIRNGRSENSNGGGIGTSSSTTTSLTNSKVYGNTAKEIGGGIHNGYSLTVSNSVIYGNSAQWGSDIANYHGGYFQMDDLESVRGLYEAENINPIEWVRDANEPTNGFVQYYYDTTVEALMKLTYEVIGEGGEPGDEGGEDGEDGGETGSDLPAAVSVSNLDDLVAAVENAKDGDVIAIDGRGIAVDHSVALGSGDKHIHLVRANEYTYLEIADGVSFTLKNMTVDGGDHEGNTAFFNITGSNSYLELDSVKAQNFNSTGGGSVIYSGSPMKLNYCVFENNKASDAGGAVFCFGGITMNGCTFSGNRSAVLAGAIYMEGSNITVTGCTFTDNHSEQTAGALCVKGTKVSIDGCMIYNNSAGGGGGGLYGGDNVTLRNCVIYGNTAAKGADIEKYDPELWDMDSLDDTRSLYEAVKIRPIGWVQDDGTGDETGEGSVSTGQMRYLKLVYETIEDSGESGGSTGEGDGGEEGGTGGDEGGSTEEGGGSESGGNEESGGSGDSGSDESGGTEGSGGNEETGGGEAGGNENTGDGETSGGNEESGGNGESGDSSGSGNNSGGNQDSGGGNNTDNSTTNNDSSNSNNSSVSNNDSSNSNNSTVNNSTTDSSSTDNSRTERNTADSHNTTTNNYYPSDGSDRSGTGGSNNSGSGGSGTTIVYNTVPASTGTVAAQSEEAPVSDNSLQEDDDDTANVQLPDNIKLNLKNVNINYEMVDGRSNIEIYSDEGTEVVTQSYEPETSSSADTTEMQLQSAEPEILEQSVIGARILDENETKQINWYEVVKIILLAAIIFMLIPKRGLQPVTQSKIVEDIEKPKKKKSKKDKAER